MKNFLVIFLFSVSFSAYTQTKAVDVVSKRAPIREVTLTGSGYSLGLQHGTLFKKEIQEIVTKWKANTAKEFGRDADEVLKEFFAYAKFDDAIKKWTPELYEEVRGIAQQKMFNFIDNGSF